MPEQANSVPESSTTGADRSRSEWEGELAAAQEEILRLRDLLIGKEAELGKARGQLAELEGHSQRFLVAGGQLQARLARIVGFAAGLRGSRGRRR